MIKEFYEDFYGCTYILRRLDNGMADLSARLPRGDLCMTKTYLTYRGARIALGKISEGTAHLTGKKEV